MRSITITLPWPISTNAFMAHRIVTPKGKRPMAIPYLTAEAKAYKEQVSWLVRAAGIKEPIRGRVQVSYQLFPHRPQDWQKRQRLHGVTWDDTVQCLDLDNAQKVLFDSLKNIAFEDDKRIFRLIGERMEPDGEARVVVTITEMQTEQPQQSLLEG